MPSAGHTLHLIRPCPAKKLVPAKRLGGDLEGAVQLSLRTEALGGIEARSQAVDEG